jgi:uncharacterized secreted protein with C-terminal beta-propeller domain
MDRSEHEPTTDRRAPSRASRRTPVPLAALVVLAAVASVAGCSADWDAAPVFVPALPVEQVSSLRLAEDCDDLAGEARSTLRAGLAAVWPSAGSRELSEDVTAGVGGDDQGFADTAVGSDVPRTTAATGAFETSADSGAVSDGSRTEAAPVGSDEIVGTNTQEFDVDEPDIVKTDGRRIVTITDGVLRVVTLDGSPQVDGILALGVDGTSEMFLRGDEAVVISSTGGIMPMAGTMGPDGGFRGVPELPGGVTTQATDLAGPQVPDPPPDTTVPPGGGERRPPEPMPLPEPEPEPEPMPEPKPMPEPLPGPGPLPVEPVPFAGGTTVALVSLADPASPTVTASASIEGWYVSSRMVDGRVRLVVQSQPEVMRRMVTSPDAATARRVVETLDGADLLPRVAIDGEVDPLGGCGDVMLLGTGAATEAVGGESFAPPSITTVSTLSIGDQLDDLQPVTIQGDADTVYASTDALYVTSHDWGGHGARTEVHRFALETDGPAAYTGSGWAPGRLLNQFSLSERGGHLRVVTTVDGTGIPVEPALPGAIEGGRDIAIEPASTTEARLTVLDTDGDSLDEVGHLGGLGIGEEVKSVRFVEHLAYVVTFRTTDPLYALDLSDPRSPRMLGELKIPGFSEYLHPVGAGLLIGVGRQADPVTGMDEGLKISLFDISDPTAMAEVDQIVLGDGWSQVAADHKAFLWDARRNQAVIPVERWGDGGSEATGGAMVVRVSGGRLDTVAELRHAGAPGVVPIRAFVIGDDLWTLSWVGLGRSSADAPGPVEQLPF